VIHTQPSIRQRVDHRGGKCGLVLDDEYRRPAYRLHRWRRCGTRRRGGAHPAHGQLHDEGRAALRVGVHLDASAVLLDDGVRHRQTETRTLTDVLRRKERIKDLGRGLGWQTGTVVTHLDGHRVVIDVVPRPNHERAAAVSAEHCLFGVDHEVEQDLLDLVRIGENFGQSRR